MLANLFNNVTEADKNSAVEGVIQHATPRHDFFLMLTLSISMAAFGILLGSTVILIGSMLIAPLLYPILSLALGIIIADRKLIGLSIYTLLKSVGFALAAGFVVGFLFSAYDIRIALPLALDMAVNAPYSLMYAIVAGIAGFAAAFAVTKPFLNNTLPGVAISVSLVPPLAEAGVALSVFDRVTFSNAIALFSVNIAGILFSSMIVFALFHFSVKKTVAQETIKKEEQVIKREAEALPKKRARKTA